MWAEEEFGGADLGDKRLNQRLVLLADRLGEQPSASIPEACRGSAEMHAAYRFLGRETLDWRELMQPHCDAHTDASGGAVHPGHDRTGFRG